MEGLKCLVITILMVMLIPASTAYSSYGINKLEADIREELYKTPSPYIFDLVEYFLFPETVWWYIYYSEDEWTIC